MATDSVAPSGTDSFAFPCRPDASWGHGSRPRTAPAGRQGPPLDALHPARLLQGRRRARDRARRGPLHLGLERQEVPRRAGRAVREPARPRPRRPRRGRRQAGRAAGLHAAVVLRAPQRDRARRAGRRLRAGLAEPGLLHQRWRRGRRDRLEARQELLQAHRQADEAQGDLAHDRLPRHHPGRAVDHRAARAQAAVRAAGALDVPRARTPTSTARPSTSPTTSRGSAAGRPTRSRSRSRTRAPTPSPRSSSSRCRTPAAASRRRPATSSGSARSATSTTCCWSPTR